MSTIQDNVNVPLTIPPPPPVYVKYPTDEEWKKKYVNDNFACYTAKYYLRVENSKYNQRKNSIKMVMSLPIDLVQGTIITIGAVFRFVIEAST